MPGQRLQSKVAEFPSSIEPNQARERDCVSAPSPSVDHPSNQSQTEGVAVRNTFFLYRNFSNALTLSHVA